MIRDTFKRGLLALAICLLSFLSVASSARAAIDQVITFTSTPPDPAYIFSTYTPTATGGGSGNPVVFTTSGFCNYSTFSDLSFVWFSTPEPACVIKANQAGNAEYNAAPEVQQVIRVRGFIQAISFQDPADIPDFVPDEQVDLTNRVSSPGFGNVVLTTNSNACTVSGYIITIVAPGTCTIDANAQGFGPYEEAEQVSQSFEIGPTDPYFVKQDQTITLTSVPPDPALADSYYSLSFTSGDSGNPVEVTTSGSCYALSTTFISLQSPGLCTISANQAGNARFNAAPQVQQVIDVQGLPLTITFQDLPDIDNFFVSERVDLSPLIDWSPKFSDGVTLTTNSTACSVAGSIVTIQSSGTCTIDANMPARGAYNAAPQVTQSFEIGPADPNYVKLDQTITFTSVPLAGAGLFYSPSATGGASGNTIVFTASGACSFFSIGPFQNAEIRLNSIGQCIITANQAGNGRYNAAAEVSQIFDVRGQRQFINFQDPPDIADFVQDEEVNLASFVNTEPNFRPSNIVLTTSSAACTAVAGRIVRILAPGRCTVIANSPATGVYEAAPPVAQSFEIGPADPNFVKQDQTIEFLYPAPVPAQVNQNYLPVARGGASGIPVVVSASGACYSNPGLAYVFFQSPGTCTISASQAGNARFNAAPDVQQVFNVKGFEQFINFYRPPDIADFVADEQVDLTNFVSSPFGANILLTSNSAACTVSGNLVTIVGPGTCTIDANSPAFGPYEAAPQRNESFEIGPADPDFVKQDQTITFDPAPPAQVQVQSYYNPYVSGGASGNPVQLAASGSCFPPFGSLVQFDSPGPCIITANQAGNARFNAAPEVRYVVDVTAIPQQIFFQKPADLLDFVENEQVDLQGLVFSTSFAPVELSTTSTACTVSGYIVTITSPGVCTIDANSPAFAIYAKAEQVSQSFNIGPIPQNISDFVMPSKQTFSPGATLTLSAAGGASGNPVVFASNTADFCTVAGSEVTIVGAGSCLISATQAGDAFYEDATPVTVGFEITPALQAISITSEPPVEATIGGTYVVTATGGASGNAIVFAVAEASAGICAIADNTVTLTGEGSCTLNANQAGTANYTQAPQVQQSFAVTKRGQSISFTSTSPATAALNGNGYIVAATASSGLPVVYSIDVASAAVCSITGNTVSFIGEGACVINANQPGDAVYAAAPQAQQGGITVVDHVGPATEAIGEFISNRANQIVTNLFDSDRQIDRLLQAQNAPGQSGSNGSAFSPDASGKGDLAGVSRLGLGAQQQSRLGSAIGSTASPSDDIFGLHSWLATQLMPLNDGGKLQRLSFGGPLSGELIFGDQLSGSFSTSLSQFESWQSGLERKQMAAMGLSALQMPQQFQRFDLWSEGSFTNYMGDRQGHFGMLTLGADYVFSPNLLAGVYGTVDKMEQKSGTRVEGQGYLIGPYATARLTDKLFWQGRAGWGKSSNTIYTVPANGDDFDTNRWLLATSLSGRWQMENGLTLTPTAAFTWFQDETESYRDGANVLIPSLKTKLGQLKFAPEFSYVINTNNGMRIEPSLNVDLLWNFESTSVAGRGDLLGEASGPDGLRGRVGVGLKILTPEGVSVTAKGSYDGIGQDGYKALSGRVGVMVQF
jgi:hypothetical protein